MKRMVFTALFAAFAMILSYIEALIPLPFFIPGAKIGLANLAVVLILFLYDWKMACMVQGIRLICTALLFGNLFSFCFSLAGACLSLAVMILMKGVGFHMVIVSMTGGAAHNAGQLIAAAFLIGTDAIRYYAPILLAAGVATGVVIGIVSDIVYPRIRKIVV